MSYESTLSQILYGIHLGGVDTIILICIFILTTGVPEKEARIVISGLAFFVLLCGQIVAGAMSVEKGGEIWDPMLQVGNVVLGFAVGAIVVSRAFLEVRRWVEGKERVEGEGLNGKVESTAKEDGQGQGEKKTS